MLLSSFGRLQDRLQLNRLPAFSKSRHGGFRKVMLFGRRFAFTAGLIAVSVMTGEVQRAPARSEIAPGIFLFRTPRYGDVGLDGNSIAVLSRDGVLVFDTNGTPAAASAVLRQIRALTNRPVRYVVNSHWHWDHWYGTEVYAKAFPGLQVITHE